MVYTPNYSRLVGIMIINHWVQWGTLFSDTPIYIYRCFHLAAFDRRKVSGERNIGPGEVENRYWLMV